MEREVKLYGPLAKFIGQRSFMAEVSSAAEALRMLIYQFPGLEKHMADQHYKVLIDGNESSIEQLHHPASQTIKFVPVIGGAGGATTKIIIGAALVAVSLIVPFGAAAIGTFGLAGTIGVGTAIGVTGGLLMLGGVSQLLSPTPQIGSFGPSSMSGRRQSTSERTEVDPQESYSFSGIQNTSRMGVPVPIVYGETIVGSIVVSVGLDTFS